MLVPVKWLNQYIDIDASTKEIAKRVTDSGSHVESINKFDEMSGLIVAEVLNVKKHENSDNLSLVELDYGIGNVTLVTGANNMKSGDKVVYAQVGAKLPGDIVIKEATLQGVVSKGMLCGYEELGINENYVSKDSHGGLIILSDDAQVGDDAIKYLDLDGEIIEFEITPNRPDCLSIIGMAREVAAVFDTKVKEPCLDINIEEDDYNNYFSGVNNQSKNINRFLTAVIKDVKIKKSPMYIQNYLRDAGMRPINNIVDFTNFVMLEYGQPLHAYDLDKINGNTLILREGKEGEKLITLDEQERDITSEDILICDGENTPIGFAGIMGGQSTEITENTKNILIEAACFDSEFIRRTSKRLGLRSEASSRFEKGVPSKLAEYAIRRFLNLVETTESGKIVKGIKEVNEYNYEKRLIELRNSRVNQLLGLELTINESKKYLESLEIKSEINGDKLLVEIPYFREDLQIEVDLIEEIGRLYGFHNIEPKPLSGQLTKGVKSNLRNFLDEVRTNIYAQGFSEILTYSFISNKQFDKLNISEDSPLRNVIRILNPLGEDYSVMRTTLIGNMLDVISKNLNNKQMDLRLYEVGNTFHKFNGEMIEHKLLNYSLVGDYDFYYAKNILINLLNRFGVKNYKFEREENNAIFHQTRTAKLLVEGDLIGYVGEVSPFVLDNLGIEKRVNICEINLDKLIKYTNDNVQYEVISKYPIVERDIAFIIDENIESQKIIDIITENAGEYLKDIQLFDRYQGEQIEKGKVSLAYKILFQSKDSTLKDDYIKQVFEKIVDGLTNELDIEIRS